MNVPKQTFLRLIEQEQEKQQEVGGVFDPEQIAIMTAAFDQLMGHFKLVDRDDPLVAMVARLVIEFVRLGERDPEQIRKQVVRQVST